MTVSVRIAPSPTGRLHVGNLRAALFNFLFARKLGGVFALRLDDTDQERSTEEFADGIKKDLTWLGLNWDEFSRQSERLEKYTEALERLKASGRAYPCFETAAEIDLKRKIQLGRSLPPVYDRAALKLSQEDIDKLLAEGKKPHWRFKLNHEDVCWPDLVQGDKKLPASSVSDPVLVREDGVPLYTFCSVVDDVEFNVTHIIRGEDHVTNTAVQIQIWEALTDKPVPAFAHCPLLTLSTGAAMSKRLGTLSIASMRDEMKVEPMALCSLIAKLGTSDPIAPYTSMEKLVEEFDLSKVSHSSAKFDLEELKALNTKILHNMSFESVSAKLAALDLKEITEDLWMAARGNITDLKDMKLWLDVMRGTITPKIDDADFLQEALSLLPEGDLNDSSWKTWTDAIKEKTGRKGKQLFMPLRLALTGEDHGPEMQKMLPLMGRERILARMS